MMKSFFVLTSLALSVLAQQATIVSPTAGSVLLAGRTITVEVQQAVSSVPKSPASQVANAVC